MNRKYIKYLGILAIIAVICTVGMGIYNTHTEKIRVKGFKSIRLVLETDKTVITALMLDDIESYHKLRDMIIAFEPLDEDEFILHQEAIRKLIRSLEDAKKILEDVKVEMERKIELNNKETISL